MGPRHLFGTRRRDYRRNGYGQSTSASISGLLSTPTGIVFDSAVSPALFYATSTQGNRITPFNPDTTSSTIKVGINRRRSPITSRAAQILTVNALSHTISIVDSQTFRTRATLGIGGSRVFNGDTHADESGSHRGPGEQRVLLSGTK